MSSSSTHTRPRSRSEQPSQGGAPPKDRFPRGGGDDGGGDGHWDGGGSPREALYRFRGILAIGILADEVLFVVAIILFFARKGATHMDPRTLHQVTDWVPIHLPALLLLNTVWLLLSSATMERARHHIFREIDVLEEWLGLGKPALTASRRWLAASAVLGTAFLAGQWSASQLLAAQGGALQLRNSPVTTFFHLLIAMHGVHLLLGLGVLLFCLTGLGYLRRVQWRQIAIDAAAWFWHAMVATWILLYAVLLFGQ